MHVHAHADKAVRQLIHTPLGCEPQTCLRLIPTEVLPACFCSCAVPRAPTPIPCVCARPRAADEARPTRRWLC